MKLPEYIASPKHTQHCDLGGGWHYLYCERTGTAVMLCDPTGDRFDFSKNPAMSKGTARRILSSATDLSGAEKKLCLALINGEHLKGEEVAK